MRNPSVRRMVLTGMLFALAIVLSFIESMVTPLLGLPPGIKLGLANVVVMYALYFLSGRQALLLVALKGGASFFRGAVSGILSLSGSLLSFLVMYLLLRLFKQRPSVFVVSVAGAVAHNLGQFVAVRFLLGPSFWVYAPVLLVSGIVMGCLTAVTLRVLLPALRHAGLAKHDKGEG